MCWKLCKHFPGQIFKNKPCCPSAAVTNLKAICFKVALYKMNEGCKLEEVQ